MALYALHLVTGTTMPSTTIKSITIKLYLRVASSISLNYEQMYPLLDTRGLKAQCIEDVLCEVQRWESMTNCREPVTVKMVLLVHKKCKNKHP